MSLRKLKPEEKVNLAINMTDVCVRVCADNVREKYPNVKEEEFIELVRERIMFGRQKKHEV